jgi:hypothetical protein
VLIDVASGRSHPIGGTVVIGSAPGNDPEVTIGTATMIEVDDPGVDEVQVRIRMSGQGVTVENVTGGQAWIQASGGPMAALFGTQPLLDRSQIRVGGRTFVFRAGPGREA